MRYKIDHDYHIHSGLSLCSKDAEQNPERILEYAVGAGLGSICLTDHFWDSAVPGASDWYQPQDFEHISSARPLPKREGIEFLFGCEADMDKFFTLGISPQRFQDFDFVVIPTTHMHMTGFTVSEQDDSCEARAALWVKRLRALLDMELPFGKIGIAHLACRLICKRSREDYIKTLDLIPEADMRVLFSKAARLGCGIELNKSDMSFADEDADSVLRPFRIAKECGAKFYLGTDAHHPRDFERSREVFDRAIDLLGLSESDKFRITK